MPVVTPLGTNGIDDFKSGKSMLALGVRGSLGLPGGFGFATYGISEFGDDTNFGGVYQRRITGYNNTGYVAGRPRRTYWVRMRHSHSSDPKTETQQAWRGTFADAMTAWKNLTPSEKSEIIEEATRSGRRPHNYFVSRYLKEHNHNQ